MHLKFQLYFLVKVIDSIKFKGCLFFHLRRLYLSLSTVSKEISDFYSLPMLFCIIHILITSILYLYYNGDLALYYNDSIKISIIIAYINCFLWSILYFFSLVVITKASSKAVAEVKKKVFISFFYHTIINILLLSLNVN